MSSTPKSIGFMRSSKVNLVMGGLLVTGGGTACTLDVAKSLVLRGCLRQKMGRRKQAEHDYRRALRICKNRLHEIDGRLNTKSNNNQALTVGNEKHGESVQRRGKNFGEMHRRQPGSQSNVGGKEGAPLGRKQRDVPDDANSFKNDSVTKALDNEDPPAFRGSSDVFNGAVGTGDSSSHQDGRCEVLKLKSLIHHNLATVHLATVLGTDIRVSFHKVRLVAVHDRLFMRTPSFRSAPRVTLLTTFHHPIA